MNSAICSHPGCSQTKALLSARIMRDGKPLEEKGVLVCPFHLAVLYEVVELKRPLEELVEKGISLSSLFACYHAAIQIHGAEAVRNSLEIKDRGV